SVMGRDRNTEFMMEMRTLIRSIQSSHQSNAKKALMIQMPNSVQSSFSVAQCFYERGLPQF
ncbi:MAG: hypothetical protein KDE31_00620, partial [Caldilineaceae bacterium]|nr:hypothetical protein [Caldilineaceae bacterium]